MERAKMKEVDVEGWQLVEPKVRCLETVSVVSAGGSKLSLYLSRGVVNTIVPQVQRGRSYPAKILWNRKSKLIILPSPQGKFSLYIRKDTGACTVDCQALLRQCNAAKGRCTFEYVQFKGCVGVQVFLPSGSV